MLYGIDKNCAVFFVHIRGCVIKSLHLLCIPHNSQPILGELSGNFE